MRGYGEVRGVPVGTVFPNRIALSQSGVHRPRRAGVSGSSREAADSIVLSRGYEDDEDFGDEIVYTGQGGADPVTATQIADQEIARGTAGLMLALERGTPVRVIRGALHDSPFSPEEGYRYDGLFRVVDAWAETGRSGFRIYRFRLRALADAPGSGDVDPGAMNPDDQNSGNQNSTPDDGVQHGQNAVEGAGIDDPGTAQGAPKPLSPEEYAAAKQEIEQQGDKNESGHSN